MKNESLQNGPFSSRQIDSFTFRANEAARVIDFESPYSQNRITATAVTSGYSCNPGRKFIQVKWFYEIIVGAAVKAVNAGGDLILRGQNHYWNRVATAAQLAQQVNASTVG